MAKSLRSESWEPVRIRNAVKILVIKPSSLGDIIHGLLVADRIRSQLPSVQIDWVARDVFAGLVGASGIARKVLRFQRSPVGFMRICREIRQETYDVTLDMQGLARSGVMTFVSHAKIKLGRFDSREGSGMFYKVKVPRPRSPLPHHAVEILRQFQRPLGLYDLAPEVLKFPDSPEVADPPTRGAILLFPESRRADKEWPGFAELAHRLAVRFPERTIAWMGTGNQEIPGRTDLPANFVDYRRRIPVKSLPSTMKEAAVVVANDSGPMHLAAAMARPVVALFGPTDPRQYGPYPSDRPSNVVIREESGDLSKVDVGEVEKAVIRLAGNER